MSAPPPVDHRTWAARFGWAVGGSLGLALGFLATYALEMLVLRARVSDPTATAARASALLVPLGFIAGALSGHAFGARGGAARYRALGVASGVCLVALAWVALVLTR